MIVKLIEERTGHDNNNLLEKCWEKITSRNYCEQDVCGRAEETAEDNNSD